MANTLTRREFLKASAAGSLSVAAIGSSAAANSDDKRRNFLVIVTDQHRTDSIGAYGSKICRTPSLDGLSESGVRFDNAYTVCALCTPTRASMYTGLYPHKHKLTTNTFDRVTASDFLPQQRLISHYFNDAGYNCGLLGKWHCGVEKLPRDYGFDGMNFSGYGKCTNSPQYQQYLKDNNLKQGEIIPLGTGWYENWLLMGKVKGPVEATVPYFLAEQTIDYLKKYKESDKPFLLYCNFWGPHAPYLPAEPYASMYKSEDIPPWPNFYEDFKDKPNAHKRYRDAFIGLRSPTRGWGECAAWATKYFGFVTMIDAQIGRILDELKRLGLEENTTVIFTADGSDLLGAHGGMHDKGSMMYQETYHVPFIVRRPGGSCGKVVERPVTNMDICPTLLDLAGIKADSPMDGRSIRPLLEGEGSSEWRRDVMCVFNGHHYLYQSRMITDGKFKFVFNAPEIDELYDLENDPWETTNLVFDRRFEEKVRDMRGRLVCLLEKYEDPLSGWAKNLFAKREKRGPDEYKPYG